MIDPELCPKCGKRLPEDAPTGLCPSCLLAAAFAVPEPDASPDRFFSPTTPGTAKFVPPSTAALAPLFPQLEILGLLGHGGMGAVYKARQKKLDRLVALKIIRPEAAADPAFAERFNREARTLARLSHPHIVAVHDFGEVSADDGKTAAGSAPVFYFLMEYVDGANLRQLMDGRRLPSDQALAIVPQVCEALQFAHDEGVVHRDIKPENILIDSKGRVKIADFGLAKLVVGSADEFTLTGTHQIMGTPRYMAPEQMEGSHSVDHRADIYSLGVVFYEMLTGQVPAGHFDPPSKKADSDPKLDAIVLRAMAREPERRFQQASHLGSEVKSMMSGSAIVNAEHAQQSVRAGAMDAEVPAVSEFLSREARAVYHWVAGSNGQAARHSASPQWLMLLMCLIAGTAIMFPWFDIYITDTRVTGNLDSRYLVAYKNDVPAYVMTVSALDSSRGALCGAALGFLTIVQIVCIGRRHLSLVSTVLRLLLCGLALAIVILHRSDLQYLTVTVTARDFANPESHNVFSSEIGLLDKVYVIHQLHHTTSLLPACFIIVGGLFGLLGLLAIDLKYAMFLRGQRSGIEKPTTDKVAGPASKAEPDRIARVAAWFRGTAVVVIGSAVVTLVVMSDAPYPLYSDPSFIILCAAQVLCVPLAVAAFVAAGGMTERRLRTLALIVSGLFLLPLSPAWLMTLPVGAWSLSVLLRKEIAASFLENADTAAPDSPTSRPLFPWGDFAFGLAVLLSVMGLILFAQVWTDSAWVLCSLFMVWFGIGFVEGEDSKKKMLNGAADWIAGIALPLTLGLIAYGIYQTNNAWPLVYLMAVIAGAGAGYSASTEDDSDEKTSDETEVAAKDSAITAAAPIELADTEQRGTDKLPHVPETEVVIQRPASTAPPVHGAKLSPLRKAWNEFWAGRHLWLTKAVQNVLGLAFVLSFFLFISFSTRSTIVYPTPGGPGVRATFVSFGTPSPWFEFSQNAGGTTGYGFQWRILWYSSANVVMLLGLLAYWISFQIEKAKPDFKPSWFSSPTAVFSMVGVVAVLCIILGHLPLLMPEWKQTLTGDPRPPLLIATENGNAEEVKSLLKQGADPNQQLPEGLNSPLWWTVANGDSEIFEALITAQASVDFQNDVGVTPLMLASARGDISFVSALISEGAQVNAQDTVTIDIFSVSARTGELSWPGQRLTPLMLAANSGYRDVVEILLQAGADASLRNVAGQTAAEMALSRNYRDVHDLILGSLRPAAERPPGDLPDNREM